MESAHTTRSSAATMNGKCGCLTNSLGILRVLFTSFTARSAENSLFSKIIISFFKTPIRDIICCRAISFERETLFQCNNTAIVYLFYIRHITNSCKLVYM